MKRLLLLVVALAGLGASAKLPYPIDGFEYTGIRRLLRSKGIQDGKIAGPKLPSGALKSWSEVRLSRTDGVARIDTLPAPNSELNTGLDRLFQGKDPNYSMAVMDLTPGKPVRAAYHRASVQYQPGSVGKLAIVSGMFAELARIYPTDVEARRKLLKSRMVEAGPWVRSNHHTVPVYDPATGAYQSRSVRETDVFSLYEWLDHAVSASSNAAASVLWKEVLLMRAYGPDYPPTADQEREFFKSTSKSVLGDIAISVVNDPLRAMGISEEDWRLGTFFTSYAQSAVPAPGKSWATPRGLLTFLLRLEEGRVVDRWSSLEIKRLMYQTARRIRYAAAPELSSAALYFKSGSLYKCAKEPGEDCGQYRGNVYNYMNSVATVETADGRIYMVALMSNVLRVNSAYEHLTLATGIEKLMK